MHRNGHYFNSLLLPILFLFTYSRGQTVTSYSFDIPEWLKKTNIFSMGLPPLEVANKTNVSIIGWGSIAALSYDMPRMKSDISISHRLGMKYIAGLSPMNMDINMWSESPELSNATLINIFGE